MKPTTNPIAVIGYGIAGQLLVLELLTKRNITPSQITILDENFLGGALVTHYGSVLSNTPWSKTKKALSDYLPWSKEAIEKGDRLYKEAQCMPVRDIAKLCLEASQKASTECERITTKVLDLKYDETNQTWEIQHAFGKLNAKYVFLAHGSTEKQLNIDKPHIPLSIALNKNQLQTIVDPEKDRVAVFGLSHSGTILLNHLHELGVQTYGIYNTEKPFLFARDNVYDGIKEGAEPIADSILRGEYTNTKLISWNDPLELYKTLTKATKIIYSIGFTISKLGTLDLSYDPQTAKVGSHPNLYGYGIAFPGITRHNDKTYVDVSVLSFQEQIRRTLPQNLIL